MTMGGLAHVDESKEELVKEVRRLARLDVQSKYFLKGNFMVHNNSESSLKVEMKSKKHLDPPLMELKQSVICKFNEPFCHDPTR